MKKLTLLLISVFFIINISNTYAFKIYSPLEMQKKYEEEMEKRSLNELGKNLKNDGYSDENIKKVLDFYKKYSLFRKTSSSLEKTIKKENIRKFMTFLTEKGFSILEIIPIIEEEDKKGTFNVKLNNNIFEKILKETYNAAKKITNLQGKLVTEPIKKAVDVGKKITDLQGKLVVDPIKKVAEKTGEFGEKLSGDMKELSKKVGEKIKNPFDFYNEFKSEVEKNAYYSYKKNLKKYGVGDDQIEKYVNYLKNNGLLVRPLSTEGADASFSWEQKRGMVDELVKIYGYDRGLDLMLIYDKSGIEAFNAEIKKLYEEAKKNIIEAGYTGEQVNTILDNVSQNYELYSTPLPENNEDIMRFLNGDFDFSTEVQRLEGIKYWMKFYYDLIKDDYTGKRIIDTFNNKKVKDILNGLDLDDLKRLKNKVKLKLDSLASNTRLYNIYKYIYLKIDEIYYYKDRVSKKYKEFSFPTFNNKFLHNSTKDHENIVNFCKQKGYKYVMEIHLFGDLKYIRNITCGDFLPVTGEEFTYH